MPAYISNSIVVIIFLIRSGHS